MKKSATKKNTDATIRELYGWTQEEVAAYLDVGRSHLSLHEMGERLLPAGKMVKWLEWITFTHVDNALQKARAALQLPQPGTQKLLRRASYCEWEAQKLQGKWTAAQKRYEQALNNIALCQHLLSTTPDTAENSFARSQLALSLRIANGTHRDKGPEALALLQCKIEGLLHEAEKCKQQAVALGGNGS